MKKYFCDVCGIELKREENWLPTGPNTPVQSEKSGCRVEFYSAHSSDHYCNTCAIKTVAQVLDWGGSLVLGGQEKADDVESVEDTVDCNTGHCNTGDCNTGHCNTGDCNTGDCNTGHCNTGDCNTGDWNTGDFNTGDFNTGFFNSKTPEKCLIFNKECDFSKWDNAEKPKFIYISPVLFVPYTEMTEQEKAENPNAHTTGGYLKARDLKKAWMEAWESAASEEVELLKALPNFDSVVFEEITGINVMTTPRKC